VESQEKSLNAKADAATDVINRISRHFRDLDVDQQGAILCQLVAMWVAGHYVEPYDQARTVQYRAAILERFVGQVRHALPDYASMIDAINKTGGRA